MVFALKLVFAILAVFWVLAVSLAVMEVDASGWPVVAAWAIIGFGPVLVLGSGVSAIGRWVRA